MKKLQFWTFTLLLAFNLFIAITQQGKADSNRPSINTNGMVRLVYFLPNDRPARPDRIAALKELIQDVQVFYADEMERHGFGRKTFRIETDAGGDPIVHQIDGRFGELHYYQLPGSPKILKEVYENLPISEHIHFIAIDLSYEALDDGIACGVGKADFLPSSGESAGSFALIPASGFCFYDTKNVVHPLRAATHELGHAFGLGHDYRDGDAVVGGAGYQLSACAAEWLSMSSFFNTHSVGGSPGSVALLEIRASVRNELHLRFQVSDPDGLHQAQLSVVKHDPWEDSHLIGCKELVGETQTIEFVTTELIDADSVIFQFMDNRGNVTRVTIPIDVAAVLPPPQNVSIPDQNLAAAIREVLGFGANDGIVDRHMIGIKDLRADEREIRDLGGLEYAGNLVRLFLGGNRISNLVPLSGLTKLKFWHLTEIKFAVFSRFRVLYA